ncbi:unnamed protein product [Bursaphelenchus okinawaensis]|uniref:SP-RING-type domain-containing protein n=1 Tax=Bursaphelenchus okinawaensis TaxID=465554 RepID=A0A811JTZ4_9BILA|nr:unnamed protein product [Bursaphelenchus okinawaensis]CAG9082476.1 unnamed protein product [Bursaphelenchus okinawaensis]
MASGSWDYEYQTCIRAIDNFRIQDLQAVLTRFSSAPLRNSTRKADLQKRLKDLLTVPATRRAAMDNILAMNRQRSVQMGSTIPPVRHGFVMQQPQYGRAGMPSNWQQQRIPVPGRGVGAQQIRAPYGVPNPNMRGQGNYNPGLLMNPSNIDPKAIQFTVLPFYEQKEVVMSHTLLPQYPKADNNMVHAHYKFSLPRQFIQELSGMGDLPRYEVQLRMCLADGSKHQVDAYPNIIRGYVNQSTIQFPPLMNVQAPPGQGVGQIQKRSSRSVDITQNCLHTHNNEFNLHFEWQPDRNNYVFGIWVVYHLTSNALTSKVERSCPRYYEETRTMIKQLLGGGEEDDIAMDVCRISLLCPLARIIMKRPARGKSCTHLQCFDLTNYIMMNEKRANWKCPVCNKQTLPSDLVLDDYFVEVIEKIKGQSSEVELNRDGSWRMIQDEFSDDSRPSSPKRSRMEQQASVSSAADQTKPGANQDIITLDDSDDDELQNTSNAVPVTQHVSTPPVVVPSTSVQEKLTVPTQSNGDKNTSGESVIYLSDDDGATENAPRNQLAPANKPTQNPDLTETSIFSTADTANQLTNEYKDTVPPNLLSSQAMAEISLELISFLQKLQNCERDYNRV